MPPVYREDSYCYCTHRHSSSSTTRPMRCKNFLAFPSSVSGTPHRQESSCMGWKVDVVEIAGLFSVANWIAPRSAA
eukprot:389836-Amphidinium_carterae.2